MLQNSLKGIWQNFSGWLIALTSGDNSWNFRRVTNATRPVFMQSVKWVHNDIQDVSVELRAAMVNHIFSRCHFAPKCAVSRLARAWRSPSGGVFWSVWRCYCLRIMCNWTPLTRLVEEDFVWVKKSTLTTRNCPSCPQWRMNIAWRHSK